MERETWSKTEKNVARKAYEKAYEKECKSISEEARAMAQSIQDSEDLWQLCDYLNKKRRAINDKYDYRYSVLIFVFARLLREGWITIADLDGISADKQQKIEVLAHWNPDK